jgi:hypothetical protein
VSGSGVVSLAVVWRMLDDCAPGYARASHDHTWDIRWQNKRFPRLPLGRHGRARKTERAEVELGQVRQLVRQFRIIECARKHIPALKC